MRSLSGYIGLLCAVLAGCQSAVLNLPTADNLPTPIIQVTHQPPPTLNYTASPEPSDTPTPRLLSLQDLAAQTYGERLIRRILIPEIGVNSPIVTVGWLVDRSLSPLNTMAEWDSPGPAVGWVLSSALPDQAGNVILYGHNNMYGSVFRNLGKLNAGDKLTLETGQRNWQFEVDQVLFLPILSTSAEQRLAYQSYLADTPLPAPYPHLLLAAGEQHLSLDRDCLSCSTTIRTPIFILLFFFPPLDYQFLWQCCHFVCSTAFQPILVHGRDRIIIFHNSRCALIHEG